MRNFDGLSRGGDGEKPSKRDLVRERQSDARRDQLERIKFTRRREHWRTEVEVEAKPMAPTWREFLAEVGRVSMGAVMPTEKHFDQARPACWGRASELCDRFGVRWDELGRMLELRERGSR
jgi:hypothetical protein